MWDENLINIESFKDVNWIRGVDRRALGGTSLEN